MTQEITLVAAFMTGLLGSVHCIGMCGGIVGSLSMGLAPRTQQSLARLTPYLLLYNIGRLASYVAAGLIVAWLGKQSGSLFLHDNMQLGKWLSGGFMILLGLYIAGWWRALTVLERLGGIAWRYLQPLGKNLLPVKNPGHAFLLGALWGWLPCGMVYAMLVFALSTQETLQGGLIMLSFGLGTLPTLVVLGAAANRLKQFMQKPMVRQLAGVLILLFGIYNLAAPGAHDHHAGHGDMGEHSQHQHY